MMDMYVLNNPKFRLDLTGELIRSVDLFDGFITGSSIIGGFGTSSDIDIVFSIANSEGVYRALDEKRKELGFDIIESEYNKGHKLTKPGHVTLNVVTLHPYDYCAWLFATNTLAAQHPIHDKFTRHRAFELAVTLFKLANDGTDYPTIGGAENYYRSNHVIPLSSEFDMVSRKLTELSPFLTLGDK